MAQIVLLVILGIFFLTSALKVVREYDRGVIFRLGRLVGAKGPGLIILIPLIDKMVKVSLRVITLDIPTQDIITKDNVSVKLSEEAGASSVVSSGTSSVVSLAV